MLSVVYVLVINFQQIIAERYRREYSNLISLPDLYGLCDPKVD